MVATSIATPTTLVLLGGIERAAAVTAVLDHTWGGTSSVMLLAPAGRASRPAVDAASHERLLTLPSEAPGYVIARWRLTPLVAELRAAGLEVVADVCPPTALRVCQDVLERIPIDTVVLLGGGRCWSRRGTPAVARKLRRHLAVPVVELAGHPSVGRPRRAATPGGSAWRHAPAG
jgi:hypothetical protein